MISVFFWILVPSCLDSCLSLGGWCIGSWRGGAAFIGAAWLIVLAIWAQHWIVSTRPDYNEGPGGGLGLILMSSITIEIAVGTAAFGILANWLTNKR